MSFRRPFPTTPSRLLLTPSDEELANSPMARASRPVVTVTPQTVKTRRFKRQRKISKMTEKNYLSIRTKIETFKLRRQNENYKKLLQDSANLLSIASKHMVWPEMEQFVTDIDFWLTQMRKRGKKLYQRKFNSIERSDFLPEF